MRKSSPWQWGTACTSSSDKGLRMKLNLLPTHAAKGQGTGLAWIICIIMIVASAAAAFMMGQTSKKKIDFWTTKAEEVKPAYDAVVAVSGYADKVIENSKGVIVNAALAKEMLAHNSAYPAFYDKLMPYIPSFFRVNSMTATPVSAETVSVTLRGVIQTREQYANIMLAFNRIPDVQTVTRSGFTIVEQYIPNLVQTDQTGRPIRIQDSNIPDDPMQRLQYFIARGSLSGYEQVGGFGSGQPGYRGAMPRWSEITISLVMPGKLQAPDVKATLNAVSSGSAPASTGLGGSPFGGVGGPPGLSSAPPMGGGIPGGGMRPDTGEDER